MGISTIPMSTFVSKSQQRGSPLSLSRSRFSIIYRSGEYFDWLLCGCWSCSSMLWLWRWGLSKPDRGGSRGHRSYLRRVCRLKEEGRQLKCQRKNRKSRAVKNFIFLRSIARFCMLCSQNAERLARAYPGGWSGKSWERQAK